MAQEREYANGGRLPAGTALFGECHGGECGGHWEREQVCRPGRPIMCESFYVCGYDLRPGADA